MPHTATLEALEKQFRENEEVQAQVAAAVASAAKRSGVQSTPVSAALGKKSKKHVITAEALFWGYRFTVPESAMKDLNAAGSAVTAFMSLGGTVIAASGGALAPAVGIAAAYAGAEMALMNVADHGKGVYLSATWVAAGIIVPTAI